MKAFGDRYANDHALELEIEMIGGGSCFGELPRSDGLG
jgi:hypothetical protein